MHAKWAPMYGGLIAGFIAARVTAMIMEGKQKPPEGTESPSQTSLTGQRAHAHVPPTPPSVPTPLLAPTHGIPVLPMYPAPPAAPTPPPIPRDGAPVLPMYPAPAPDPAPSLPDTHVVADVSALQQWVVDQIPPQELRDRFELTDEEVFQLLDQRQESYLNSANRQ